MWTTQYPAHLLEVFIFKINIPWSTSIASIRVAVALGFIDRPSILMVKLCENKTGSEGNMMLGLVMPPLVLQTIEELESTIDSFMTGSNGFDSSFLSNCLGLIVGIRPVVSSVALICHHSLSRWKNLSQKGSKDGNVMNGSPVRAGIVTDVTGLDVRANLIPQSKAFVLESKKLLVLSKLELLVLVSCKVSAINVEEATVTLVSNESILKPNLKSKERRRWLIRGDRQQKERCNRTYDNFVQISNGFSKDPRPLPKGFFITLCQCCILCCSIISLEKDQSPE